MVITCTNLKGGVGKTTTVMALATAAARRGKRAVVLDADPQGTASTWFYTAEEAGDDIPFAVEPANLGSLRRRAAMDCDEWVFVDCPPNGNVADAAMDLADVVVIPSSPHPADLDKTFAVAETARANGKAYGILITKARRNTLSVRAAVDQLEEMDESFFESIVYQRESVAEAFCNAFGDDLFGYGEVFEEIEGMVE